MSEGELRDEAGEVRFGKVIAGRYPPEVDFQVSLPSQLGYFGIRRVNGRVKVSLEKGYVVHGKIGLAGSVIFAELRVRGNSQITKLWHVYGKGAVLIHDTTQDAKSQPNQPCPSLLLEFKSCIPFVDMGTVSFFGSSW